MSLTGPTHSLGPLRSAPGYAAVVDLIRRELSLGRLLPGERLPAERKLADQLGVARETVRQALRVLEGAGQIQIQRGAGGGPLVMAVVVDQDAIRKEIQSRSERLLGLIEHRGIIESGAAALAAERRTAQHLEIMVAAQRDLLSAVDRDASRRADTAFHLAIAAASGNAVLEQSIEDARVEMFSPLDLLTFDFVKETNHAEHQHVLDDIRARRPASAAESMAHHITTTRGEFLKFID